jgi:uncharacterized membrane protein
MIPFLVLVVVTLAVRALGAVAVAALDNWTVSLRCSLAAMLLLTASAHWGKRRADLIRMVPAGLPRADLIVTITGIFELLGAVGLLIPATAPVAAVCLALLFVAMFPANIRAARQGLTIGGRPATALPLRAALQVVYIGAALVAGSPSVLAT